jgi:WXG100 family type VII secretion target
MPDVTGATIQVPPDLQHAGTYINGVATQIESELVALKNQLAPLLASWTGAAQSYYEGLQREWDIAADGLFGPTGVLGMIAQAMNLNWNNYHDCEWSNIQTWKR